MTFIEVVWAVVLGQFVFIALGWLLAAAVRIVFGPRRPRYRSPAVADLPPIKPTGRWTEDVLDRNQAPARRSS